VGVSVGCVLVRICASVDFTPFVTTHPRDEGMVKETWGFVGERDLLRESIEGERGFVWETVGVGAKVGRGDGMKGGSLQ
jgi:hypothetical protein